MSASTPANLLPDSLAANGPKPRHRIALVIQRYGLEINGGAELHARQVAERLAARHHVEVLTSCAVDYTTWNMHFAAGTSKVEGLTVHRFAHPARNDIGRARVPLVHKLRFGMRHVLDKLPGPRVRPPRGDAEYDGLNFLRRQGPHCPALLEHLTRHRADYDVALFFTALYEPTAMGLPAWGRRSVLVPTLHDEKPMALPHFHRVFSAAGRVFYNTPAEQKLAAKLYGAPPDAVVGLGIDVKTPAAHAVEEVRHRYGLPRRYLVYVGRIDTAKGCGDLLQAFLRERRRDPDLALVLVGRAFMPLPTDAAIIPTGFVSEADRNAIVAGAQALVLPSRYESLSMVLLEAMALGVPVVANADCDVLADHVESSGAGLLYRGTRRLGETMRQMAQTGTEQRSRWGAAGRSYVADHYTWPRVMTQYEDAIASLCAQRAA